MSIASLIVILFLLAGPKYFFGLLLDSAFPIAVISVVAGIVRLPFRNGGFGLSVVCGLSFALTGVLIIAAYAVSNIP